MAGYLQARLTCPSRYHEASSEASDTIETHLYSSLFTSSGLQQPCIDQASPGRSTISLNSHTCAIHTSSHDTVGCGHTSAAYLTHRTCYFDIIAAIAEPIVQPVVGSPLAFPPSACSVVCSYHHCSQQRQHWTRSQPPCRRGPHCPVFRCSLGLR